jgi:hypothetical protein
MVNNLRIVREKTQKLGRFVTYALGGLDQYGILDGGGPRS